MLRTTGKSLLLIGFLFFAFACSTTPTRDAQEPKELQQVEDLVQSPDVLVAVRATPAMLANLGPLLETLGDSAGLEGLAEMSRGGADPVEVFAREQGIENSLPSLDRNRSTYFLVTTRGNEGFLQAATHGLPTREEEWPRLVNLRILLPSASPETLSEELTVWLERLTTQGAVRGYEFYPGPGFLRAEVAIENRLGGERKTSDDGRAWLRTLELEGVQPPSGAQYRPTTAYLSFVEPDVSAGIWMPLESMASLGAFMALGPFAMDYRRVGPLGKPRFFLEGISQLGATSLRVDPVSAENEDLAFVVRALDSGVIVADGITSRTAHGSRLHSLRGEDIFLPGMATQNSFFTLNWGADLEGRSQRVNQPYWTILAREVEQEWSGFDQSGGLQDSFLQDETGGIASAAALLQYPTTMAALTLTELEGLFPTPRAISMEAFAVPASQTGLPVGLALTALFANTAENRSSIEQILAMGSMFIPFQFDATLVERDDQFFEVRLSLGAELAKIFTTAIAPVEAGPLMASVDLAPLVATLQGMMTVGDEFSLFDQFHLRSESEEGYEAVRVTFGSAQAQTPVVAAGAARALADPTYRCRTEFAGLGVRYFGDLRTDASAVIERWAEEARRLSSVCFSDDGASQRFVEERIELARQRGGEIP